MRKLIKNFFIPSLDNNFQPYGLSSKALSFYVIILLILQISVNFIAAPYTSHRALALLQVSSPEIVNLTNAERTARGLPALSVDSRLDAAAYNKCLDMFQKQYWDHTSPDGLTPWYFISNAGYNYIYAGENLAKGFTSSSAIVSAWMNSPSHRANILSPNFQNIGTAIMTGDLWGVRTTLCVQMFGTESTFQPAPVYTPPPSSPPEANLVPQQPTSSGSEQPSVPETKPEVTPPKEPVIKEPENGSVINDKKPLISGEAAYDSRVILYDNNKELGETKAEKGDRFVFKPFSALEEGQHKIFAEAEKNNLKSKPSSTVSFVIDTTPPLIEENTLTVDQYWYSNQENYKVKVQVLGEPTEVIASLDRYSLILQPSKKASNYYEGRLMPPITTLTQDPRKLTIKAVDKAGNEASYLVTLPKLSGQEISTGVKIKNALQSILPSDFQNIARFLYFILALWIFFLILLDGIIVYSRGITRISSHARAHLAVIFILLMSVLFSSLGIIA